MASLKVVPLAIVIAWHGCELRGCCMDTPSSERQFMAVDGRQSVFNALQSSITISLGCSYARARFPSKSSPGALIGCQYGVEEALGCLPRADQVSLQERVLDECFLEFHTEVPVAHDGSILHALPGS